MTRDEIAARLAGNAWVADHTKATLFDTAKWLLAQADALAAALDALYTNTRSPEEWARRSPDDQALAALTAYRGTP